MFLFKATVAYDGTRYFGWQATRSGPSIQEALREALAKIAREPSTPEAASRTDRGVHAEGQVVAFSLKKQWCPRRLRLALNSALPPDIRVREIEEADPDFHPTLQAKEKEYRYYLCPAKVQEPTFRLYSWHYGRHRRPPLEVKAMEEAAAELLGKRDFSAFSNERSKNPFCTLAEISFTPLPYERLQIALRGDRFLYKMVRNLVSLLLAVGSCELSVEAVISLLESKDRAQGKATAPAHGLFLHRVFYSGGCD